MVWGSELLVVVLVMLRAVYSIVMTEFGVFVLCVQRQVSGKSLGVYGTRDK